ncbi:MAG: ATP-binding protein [Candidatus Hodarchaeota archaeon]
MMDDENLWIGYTETDPKEDFKLPTKIFAKHLGIFGSTGSGKTVAGKIMMEEMALQKIPCIILDPQGDLASLLIRNDDDFLTDKGVPLDRVNDFYENTEIRVYTPTSNKGLTISLNPIIFPPFDVDHVEAIRILDNSSNTLIEILEKLVKYSSSKSIQAKSVIYSLLFECWKNQKTVENIAHLVKLLENDKEIYIKFMSDNDKEKLLISLNNLLIGATGLLFSGASQLDLGELIKTESGKTPINIFFLKSLLNEDEKHLFISILIQALYSWMIQQGSTESLKCFFYIDEIAPFLPAGMSSPPGKEMLLLLLRQARKYGVACALASQSPRDIDYKGLDNLNSFYFGRIISQQSQRVIKNLLQSKLTPDEVDKILDGVSILTSGHFLSFLPEVKEGGPIQHFQMRWLFSKHLTLTETDLAKHYEKEVDELVDEITIVGVEDIDQQGEGEEPPVDQEGPPADQAGPPTVGQQPPIGKIEPTATADATPLVQESERIQLPRKQSARPVTYEIFQPMSDNLLQDIMERTVNYDYFEKLPSMAQIEDYVDLPTYDSRIFEAVKNLLDGQNYEVTDEETATNGVPILILQDDFSAVIVTAIVTHQKVKIGIFGAYENKSMKIRVKKVVEAVKTLLLRIQL